MPKGYWEQPGRNPAWGALIFVMFIGAIYFILQALILNGYILVDMAVNASERVFKGNYFQRLEGLYNFYQKPILIMLMASQFFIFLIPSILLYRKWHNTDWLTDFQLKHISWVGIAAAALGTLLFLPLAEVLSNVFYRLFPGLEELSNLQLPLFMADSPGQMVLLLTVIGLTPAICEEVLFRGYLQSALSRKYGDFRIIIISGVLFALYHQNPLGLLTLTAAGLWLGLLTWRFKSLYTSMTAHLVYNSSIILLVNGKIRGPFLTEQGSFTVWFTLTATLGFALIVWWIWNFREDKNEKTA